MKEEIIKRLDAFRAEMRKAGIAAVVIPQTDAHLGEYIASHWQVRRWLSGFTGSAGTLVVTLNEALLWTDSRYFIQAALQLDGTGIKLMKEGIPGTPTITQWLVTNLVKGQTVGIDGFLFPATEADAMGAVLAKHDLKLDTHFAPIDTIWTDRPGLPADPVFLHDVKYAGRDAADKMKQVLTQTLEQGATSIIITDLTDVAWTLNIRSSDVSSTPVATSFLYLAETGAVLFINPAKIDDEVRAYLAANNVEVAPYESVVGYLENLPATATVLVEPSRVAARLRDALGARAVSGASPVALLKAVKNSVQLQGIRRAMESDGAALVGAFMEIERRNATGESLTELDVADILTEYRSKQPEYFEPSFDTIAGYGPHGAIVHYSATEESSVRIEPHGLLLIDSGAQYKYGTTDITRTICMGTPTADERHDFTLVMKGHIALAQAIYPEGTRGGQLDALARQFLWKEGLSYLHGTGHGVGHFLSVHEGPQSIRLNDVPYALQPGMMTSNEPGLYREGVHGTRCENLVLTVPAFTTEMGNFFRFETMTLFPFDLNLFDTAIMTDAEIDWVNGYHREVRSRLTPLLTPEQAAWLETKTQPLVK